MSDIYKVEQESIHLRRQAKEMVDNAAEEGYSTIDLSAVEFVSRSVADELIHKSEQHDVELVGLEGDVDMMIEAVSGQLRQTAD